MQKIISYFFSGFNLQRQSLLFKRALYVYLFIKCCYWLAYYDILFGENSVSYTTSFDLGVVKNLAFLLYGQSNPCAGLWFIIPLMILCLLNIFKLKIHFLFDLIIWFIVINIHNKIYATITGGDLLINQLLFFNCFISDKFSAQDDFKSSLKISAHNFGVLAVIIQVCIVYFFSAIAKLTDESWMNGTAVLQTSQINHFTLPWVAQHSSGLKPFLIFLNYFVLAYQLLFPFVVWIKKTKKIFLFIGILMHLYIAFVMGLVSFGLVMILCYIYFWPAKKD